MRNSRAKLPSPAMIVALVALFVALGGSAYAVNKVGTKEIKNGAITAAKLKKNAVTAAKIKKNAVTAAKIKNNAVTGAKINEGTLGAVPNATDAVNAENFSRYFTSGLKKASIGQEISIASVGPFSFTGVCKDLGGGEYQSFIKATTSQSGGFFTSDESSYYEADFDPGDQGLASEMVTDDSPYWYGAYGYYEEWSAASADGSLLLRGHGDVGIKVFGADCAFLLTWESNA